MSQPQAKSHQEHHDAVCVGFGPAAISFGIALKEGEAPLDIVFLESSQKSSWRPLMDLPANVHMGSNFLNDLVTLENPRSNFTFIRYLHQRKLLVEFTNLGSMQPSRELFEKYIIWCSKAFEDNVHYNSRIVSIEPTYGSSHNINGWNVFTINRDDGTHNIYTAKKVIICMGQQPSIPTVLDHPSLEGTVFHSSNSKTKLRELQRTSPSGLRIAIIGQTQQAAELYQELYDVRAGRKITWLVENKTLNPETNVPLNANDPLITETKSSVPPEVRIPTGVAKICPKAINADLIKQIYENQYAQSVKQSDNKEWDFRIIFDRKVVGAEKSDSGRVYLTHQSNTNLDRVTEDFDVVIAATGFERSSANPLLLSLTSKRLLDGSSITVDSEYTVNIRRGVLESGVGLWCVGSVGDAEHAVGDGAFRVMAERSARLTASIKSCGTEEADKEEVRQVQAQL